MESLSETNWDVVIAGTGIEQSLLALALSRSGKKMLHVDKNDYYGGSAGAFSLQEAEGWAQKVNEDAANSSSFKRAAITKPEVNETEVEGPKLSFSRSYSLSLAPHLIYTRSPILPVLVSSKVYRQLEFLAVGSWWVYSSNDETSSDASDAPETGSGSSTGRLTKVPSGREDIFSDNSIDFKAKRLLMKFLRFVGDYESQEEVWQEHRSEPFSGFLEKRFNIPRKLQAPLLALTLSLEMPQNTTIEFALPRIANHLRSIGVFGPGFACVIPKWGGLAEISQIACRAQAVGGGIYVLGQGITAINTTSSAPANADAPASFDITAHLKEGDVVKTKWIVGTEEDLPTEAGVTQADATSYSRSITIVFSTLELLFPPLAEGAPAPAGAVVSFPTGSLAVEGISEHPPVYVFVHSSDTGECPVGQSVLYACTLSYGEQGVKLLDAAVKALLHSVNEEPSPTILWALHYEQRGPKSADAPTTSNDNILAFPPSPVDLKFDGDVLDHVKSMWQKIAPDTDPAEFMKFEDREAEADEYMDDDE